MPTIQLRRIAQARCGDKGDTADISLFAPNERLYDVFRRQVTAERVLDHFRGIARGPVTRHEVPKLLALKFVIGGALGGGAAASLRTDNLGKALGSAFLRITVEVDEAELAGVTILRCPDEFQDAAPFPAWRGGPGTRTAGWSGAAPEGGGMA